MELLTKLDEKLNQQTLTIIATNNVMQALDENMKKLLEENKTLKTKITNLLQKIHGKEKEKSSIFWYRRETENRM